MNRRNNKENIMNGARGNTGNIQPSDNDDRDVVIEEVPEEEHNVIDSVKDKSSKNPLELIPYRLRNHVKYLKLANNRVKCSACNLITSSNIEDVLNHVMHEDHLRKSSLRLPHYSYECEICGKKMRNENKWANHMHLNEHLAKIQKLGQKRREKLKEHECLSCSLVIFGDKMSITRHKKTYGDKNTRDGANQQVSLKKGVKDMFLNAKATETLANKLLKISDDSMKHDDLVRKCMKALVDCMKDEYPDCEVYLFGSRKTGLGDSKSDVDIFIDVGGLYMGQIQQERKEQIEIFQRVKSCISGRPEEFIQIQPIPSARTPIIQMTYIGSELINCDISFSNGLSVENTKFIKFCFELQPLVRPSMLVLKYWANEYYLKEELSSYAFCMMFFFYLQVNGYLLTVDQLRKYTNVNPPKISHWKIIDYNRPIDIMRKYVRTFNGTIFDMLKGFFDFYQDFNFDMELVCPLLGRTILVNKFDKDGEGLPVEMKDYSESLALDCDCEFNRSSTMCVQDPFDLGHNLTKRIPPRFRSKFQKVCKITYDYMCNTQ